MYDGYDALAKAIVYQAVKDYYRAVRYNKKENLYELESFFRSDYYSTLTKIDGEAIMKRIKEMVKNGEKL